MVHSKSAADPRLENQLDGNRMDRRSSSRIAGDHHVVVPTSGAFDPGLA
jgi:hypothetical protein